MKNILAKLNPFAVNEIGYVDAIRNKSVHGWVKDTNNPKKSIEVVIKYDGKVISQIRANKFRQDLLEAGHGDGEYAFDAYNLPAISDKKLISVTTKNGTLLKVNQEIFKAEIIEEPKEEWDQQVKTAPHIDQHFWNHWDANYIQKHVHAIQKHDSGATHKKTRKFVALIGDLNLPQCKKYRVLQKIELLKRQGINADLSHWEDVPRSLNLIERSSTVIFYRIPECKLTSTYLQEATRLKIKVIYDIDDPIFDATLYENNVNIDHLSDQEKQNLISNAPAYASILRQCDSVTVSTPALVELASKYTKQEINLWRNLMDSQSLNAKLYVENTTTPKVIDETEFVIGYMSGSRAHEADFKMAFNALNEVMDTNPIVKLLVIGHADLAKKLKERFKDRVILKNFSEYFDYLAYFAEIDLNIIPLVQNEFNDCKSAIRYLEASLIKKPTIVSKIGDFINIITDKENGYLIEDNTDKNWIEALEYAIENRNELTKVGINAHNFVLKNYTSISYNLDSVELNMIA